MIIIYSTKHKDIKETVLNAYSTRSVKEEECSLVSAGNVGVAWLCASRDSEIQYPSKYSKGQTNSLLE